MSSHFSASSFDPGEAGRFQEYGGATAHRKVDGATRLIRAAHRRNSARNRPGCRMFHVKRFRRRNETRRRTALSRSALPRFAFCLPDMRKDDAQCGRRHPVYALRFGNRARPARAHLLLELIGQAGKGREIHFVGYQPRLLAANNQSVRGLPLEIDRIAGFSFEGFSRLPIDRAELRPNVSRPNQINPGSANKS